MASTLNSAEEVIAAVRALAARRPATASEAHALIEDSSQLVGQISLAPDLSAKLPEFVWHFLSDADIRCKDSRYADAQLASLGPALDAWANSLADRVPRAPRMFTAEARPANHPGAVLNPLVLSITQGELAFVASLDYGQDVDKHLAALREVIFSQDGILREGQLWFPYEVIELGSYALKPGHEREFAICTLLVIQAVASGFDKSKDLDERLSHSACDYDRLPSGLRDEVLSAYSAAAAARSA